MFVLKSSSSSSPFFLVALIVVALVAQWESSSSSSVVNAFAFPTKATIISNNKITASLRLSVEVSSSMTENDDVSVAAVTNGISESSMAEQGSSLYEKLVDLFNRQITQEFIASQTYLSASIWFNQNDWEGMASYMLSESDEERVHGLGFVDFANKRNIPIELMAVPAPQPGPSCWNSPEDVWRSILELERTNTKSLLNLAEAANECNDFAVLAFLNPFHMTQVNEEDKIGGILAKVRDENRTPGLLRSLDIELGSQAGN